MTKWEQWQGWPSPAERGSAVRRLAAGMLGRGSRVLARLAAALAVEPSGDRPEQTVEFHAEAGAPEGALYIDGRLVGWIEGIRRL